MTPRHLESYQPAHDSGKELPGGDNSASTRPRTVTGRLLSRTLRYRKTLAIALVTMVIGGITDTAPIFLAKVFVDQVLVVADGNQGTLGVVDTLMRDAAAAVTRTFGSSPNSIDPRLAVAFVTALVMLILATVAAVSTYANEFIAKYLASLVVRDLRVDLLASVVRLPYAWFTRRKMGDLVSRFSNDTTTTFQTINIFVSELLLQPFVLIGCAAGALIINWRLAIAALVFFPAVVYPVYRLGRRVLKRSKKTLVSLGETMESVNQTLSGLRVVKSFRMEHEEVLGYARVNDAWLATQVSLVKAKALGRSIMDLIWGFVLAIVLLLGAALLVNGTWGLTAGAFSGFLVALMSVFRPIKRLSQAYNTWLASVAASGRVFEVMDTAREAPDPPGARTISGIQEGIRFENVDFSYEDDDTKDTVPVLRGLNFDIPAHRTVALVGPSGAGKSTVANLLFRFYDPDRGRILIDGVPINEISRTSLLDRVALVSQHPFLFNTTVRENIAYGRPGASQSEIEAAAKAACIHDDIVRLPRGYDMIVGERGATLSGGQMQRVTIARAILKDASLLVLDEATSSLDTHSERAVQQALENLLRGKTALVIAHRLSTIAHADTIFVMQDGRIVEEGTHQSLLAGKGAYHQLYAAQAG